MGQIATEKEWAELQGFSYSESHKRETPKMKTYKEYINETSLSPEQKSGLRGIGLDDKNSTDIMVAGDDDFWIVTAKANKDSKFYSITSDGETWTTKSKKESKKKISDEGL